LIRSLPRLAVVEGSGNFLQLPDFGGVKTLTPKERRMALE
jgi:hypothetical protein